MNGLISLALTLAFSTSLHAQSSAEVVVAQVGSKKITLAEFNKKYSEVKSQAINPPTRPQFLEDMIRYEVGLQEADKRGLDKDPLVQDRINQERYKALLEKDLGQQVQKIQVSESEMKAWYSKNPELRTSHILIEYKPGASEQQVTEARKRAQEILSEVRSSKRSFEELVKLYSDDPLSKQSGGDVGWQSKVTLFPTYYDAAFGMKINEIKGLVETPFGFHIVKLTGRRGYDDANKRQIRAAVYDEKRKQAFNNYFDRLKKQYSIKSNPSAVQ